MTLTDEQKLLVKDCLALKTNKIILASAGSGKSFVIQHLITALLHRHRQVVVLTPTGSCTQNLFAKIGDTKHVYTISKCIALIRAHHRYRNALPFPLSPSTVFILDEIGLTSATLLSAFNKALISMAKSSYKRLPFGGMRVYAFGDVFQLSPVDGYFFEMPHFDTLQWHISQPLTKNIRAKDDPDLDELLQRFRSRRGGWIGAYAVLSHISNKTRSDNYNRTLQGLALDLEDTTVHICRTHEEIDLINNTIIDTFPRQHFFVNKDKTVSIFAKYARIRINHNIYEPDGTLIPNGMCGIILSIRSDKDFFIQDSIIPYSNTSWYFKIQLDAEREPRIIRQQTVKEFNIAKNKQEKVRKWPFVLGYAMTLASAQGLTLPRVCIHHKGFTIFDYYTAMSRVTHLQHLTVQTPITPETLEELQDRANIPALYAFINKHSIH